jgi:hypothetical protein
MGWSEAHSALVRRETGSEQEPGSVRTSTIERSAVQVVSMTSTTSRVSGKPAAIAAALGVVGAGMSKRASTRAGAPWPTSAPAPRPLLRPPRRTSRNCCGQLEAGRAGEPTDLTRRVLSADGPAWPQPDKRSHACASATMPVRTRRQLCACAHNCLYVQRLIMFSAAVVDWVSPAQSDLAGPDTEHNRRIPAPISGLASAIYCAGDRGMPRNHAAPRKGRQNR